MLAFFMFVSKKKFLLKVPFLILNSPLLKVSKILMNKCVLFAII